jgi:hypothetical protein
VLRIEDTVIVQTNSNSHTWDLADVFSFKRTSVLSGDQNAADDAHR